MAHRTPLVVLLAGPDGAGKGTAAWRLLRDTIAVEEFANADAIAQGISAYRPKSAAVAAGHDPRANHRRRSRVAPAEGVSMIDSTTPTPSPADRVDDVDGASRALALAVRDALRIHKRDGSAVPVWRNERVLWIPAEQIPVDPEPTEDT